MPRTASTAAGLAAWLTWSTGCLAVAGNEAPLLLRDPALSATQIAFSYAQNIWIANRDGTGLHRLTSSGHEAKPAFSPDGSQIAFVGSYDGTTAVYVVHARGGQPQRLTYHPADFATGPKGRTPSTLSWTPDGKQIVFSSRRAAFAGRMSQLFSVPAVGGFVTEVPLLTAAQIAFSSDATHVAYVPNIQRHLAWKRYRGGETTPICIADLTDSQIQAVIPRDNSNDFNPMWVDNKIYFLSDRNGPVTLFAYDPGSKQVSQILRNDGLDIKSAAAYGDSILYEQFGSLHLLNLNTGIQQPIRMRPVADFPELRPHFKHIDADEIRFAGLSPDGSRGVLSAHGDILTAATQTKDIRNLTHTTDAVERDPAWSPDGKSIAYLSDESGEYALHIRTADGLGRVRKISLGHSPNFYYSPVWSPDGGKIAYTDKRLSYWYVDLKKSLPVRVDTDEYVDGAHELQPAWSPDSRWIAYTKQLRSHFHAVFIHSIERNETYQLTDGTSDALRVTFDKGGYYLYFTASTDIALSTDWLAMHALQRPITYGVYSIDLNDPERRIVPLPIPARNYYGLFAVKPGVLFLVEGPQLDPLPERAVQVATRLLRFDTQAGTLRLMLDGVTSYFGDERVPSVHMSSDGEHMLYAKDKSWFVQPMDSPASAPAATSSGTPVELNGMEVYVEPRKEWKHMFGQIWRSERDFFYDPGLHGLQLDRIEAKYAPYLDNIASRDDLNYLFNEMLGNMRVGHLGAFGGDTLPPGAIGTGLLGADYTVANGRYRFERVYAGDTWNPEVRSPLTQPAATVRNGEYLLEVNGVDVRPTADVYSYFQETADRPLILTVGSEADGRNARHVTVIPVKDESLLRNHAWVEQNRRTVDELTAGRVAYIYMPDTKTRGYEAFNREYFAQVGKEAAIIDERYNEGGYIPDYVIELLSRPLKNYWHMHEGDDVTSPQEAIFGPKVMIINEMAGSGGDLLPWMFRQAGIGPLIGKRTWGGLIGNLANRDLMDGGGASTPNLAFYNTQGHWDVENHGVAPDIEVEADPAAHRAGHDRQLEEAVEVVMNELRKKPPATKPQHPPFPNYQLAVQSPR